MRDDGVNGETLDDLRAGLGLDGGCVALVVRAHLANSPPTDNDLALITGVPHRIVRRVRQALRTCAGDPAEWLASAAGPPTERSDDDVLPVLRVAFAGLPPSVWGLDHVSATPETALRRARFLTERYDLATAQVLCLGDHDLTSVALKLLDPNVAVSVVDVDERLLEYLAGLSRMHGLDLHLSFADLRIELPPGLGERFDLVFSDPPYTEPGFRLFTRRALEALRPNPHMRYVFAYGFNERQLDQGLAIQRTAAELRLVPEALIPDFNEYDGAPAIGGRSGLWTYRTSRNTPAALRSMAPERSMQIYTRGRASEEAESGIANLRFTADVEFAGVRLSEAAVLTPHSNQSVLVNLLPFAPNYLIRAAFWLAGCARATIVTTTDAARRGGVGDLDDPIHSLIASSFEVTVENMSDDRTAVTLTHRPDEPETPEGVALNYLLFHGDAGFLNAAREAIIRGARIAGADPTKNQARSAFATAIDQPGLFEAPAKALPTFLLREGVTATLRALRDIIDDGNDQDVL